MRGAKVKMEYSKPQIVFESFQLSTSIAAECKIDSDTAIEVPGVGTVLLDGPTCSYVPLTEEDYVKFGICYDVPTTDNKLFNS